MEISALKGEGSQKAAEAAVAVAEKGEGRRAAARLYGQRGTRAGPHRGIHRWARWTRAFLRWYAVKIFERDAKVKEELNLPADLSGAHRPAHRRLRGRDWTMTPRASLPTSATRTSAMW